MTSVSQGGQDSIHRWARTPLISAMVCELNQQLGAVRGMFCKCISQWVLSSSYSTRTNPASSLRCAALRCESDADGWMLGFAGLQVKDPRLFCWRVLHGPMVARKLNNALRVVRDAMLSPSRCAVRPLAAPVGENKDLGVDMECARNKSIVCKHRYSANC